MATSQLYLPYCNMNIETIGNGLGALGSINGYEQMQIQLQMQMQMFSGNGNSNGKNGTRSKIKTSLCKKWMETGSCPYGYKCQFAHGLEQLRCNVDQNSYKTKPCNAFFKKGYCQYGDRCNFAHREFKQVTDTQEKQNSSKFIGYQQVIKEGLIAKQGGSRLLKIRGLNPQIYDEKYDGSTDDGKSQSLSVSRSSISSSKALSQSFVQFGQQSQPLTFSTTFFSHEHGNSDKQSQTFAFALAENQQNFSIFPFYSITSVSTPSESDLEQQEQFAMQKQMQPSQNYFNFLI